MPWTYEYDPATGFISGAVNNIIPLSQADPVGRALFRDNDTNIKTGVMVDITKNPPVLIDIPPTPINYSSLAQLALDDSDKTILRCYESGVVVPIEWQAYRKELRAIVNGSQNTELPDRPPYPIGT